MRAKITSVFLTFLTVITVAAVAYVAYDYYQRQTEREEVSAPTQNTTTDTSGAAADTATSEAAPSEAQVEALEYLGIDAESISNVTPEQEACFERTLGADRVAAIKAGAVPGAMDLVQARECI